MGGCCFGRNPNETIFDEFFKNMKFVEENTKDVCDFIDNNINSNCELYNGDVVKFMNSFFVIHVKNDKYEKWTAEARNFFENQYTKNFKNHFNLIACLIILSKFEESCNEYGDSILKLANKFKIPTKDNKEISKSSLEMFILSYIKFVSLDAVNNVKNLSPNPQDFAENYANSFTIQSAQAMSAHLMKDFVNKDFINIYEFIEKNNI